MNAFKKYFLFLAILIVLVPVGLYLPHVFKAGDAWGEWSVEQVKEQTGKTPEGMQRDAEIYKAPIPDYNLGNENSSLAKQSGSYIISALIGTGIILILTFGFYKLFVRPKE